MGAGASASRGVAWIMGPQALGLETYRSGVRKEALVQMDVFDGLWDSLKEGLQEPIWNGEGQLGGYSGHRVVTFEDQMGRCALGFYLHMTGGPLYRTITAQRRKLYDDDLPKLKYMSDNNYISMSDIRYHDASDDMRHDEQLGVMAVWVKKYLAAKPYEELPYYDS